MRIQKSLSNPDGDYVDDAPEAASRTPPEAVEDLQPNDVSEA